MEKIKFTISLVFLPVFFVPSMGTYLNNEFKGHRQIEENDNNIC